MRRSLPWPLLRGARRVVADPFFATTLTKRDVKIATDPGLSTDNDGGLLSFLERMSEGAVSTTPEGEILFCNKSFETLVNTPATEIVRAPFESFVWEEDRRYVKHLLRQAWQGEVKGEVSLMSKARYVPVQIVAFPQVAGEGVRLNLLVTDLTPQKEAQTSLRQKNQQLAANNSALELSNHDLQQFASVASHDLQEPIRKIQIFSSGLLEKHAAELTAPARQFVEKIVVSADRMKVLLADILNYSKLSAKGNKFELTDLNKLIHDLMEDMALTIEETKARMIVDHLPKLEINPGQLRQAFQNLLSNAIKFSRKGVSPVVTISVILQLDALSKHEEYFGKFCHIRVKDNGIGFDEKYANTIFNLFEKLHSKDEYEGTGIGLAIAKKIVEKHNGYITVKSKPGVGSEFIVSLPMYQRAD